MVTSGTAQLGCLSQMAVTGMWNPPPWDRAPVIVARRREQDIHSSCQGVGHTRSSAKQIRELERGKQKIDHGGTTFGREGTPRLYWRLVSIEIITSFGEAVLSRRSVHGAGHSRQPSWEGFR